MSGTDTQPGYVAPAVAPADSLARGLRLRAFAAMALVLITFAAFWPGTVSLLESWEDTAARTYTHGYVVLVLGLWMIWRDRRNWAAGEAQPFVPAALVLIFGGLCWLIAFRAGLQIVYQAALPLLLAAAVSCVFGWRMLRGLAFPIAWLYLAIPVWDALLPVLNWISVMVVRFLLRASDVPAYFINNTFELPAGTFAIADGCSGLHFFVVALTVSLLYGELNSDSKRVRVRLVAFALLLAMATNWLRIYVIVLAGHLTHMQHRLVVDEHYSFGWYMFAGMMVIYFLVVRRWLAEAPPAAPAPAFAGAVVPRRGACAAALGLALVPVWTLADANRAGDAELAVAMRADAAFDGVSEFPGEWRPEFAGASRTLWGEFHDGEKLVEVYVAGFRSQGQREELAASRNSVPGKNLRARRSGGALAPWTELQASGAGGSWIVWYAYRLDDRWYSSALKLQLEYGIRSLWDAPAAAVIALRARCGATDCEAARESLKQVVEAHYP